MQIFALIAALLVTLSSSREVAGTLPFEIPVLQHMTGTISPTAGHHLQLVTISTGDEGLFANVNEFMLVTSTGAIAPIGAGSNGSIVPFDRLPIDREIGQVLASNALLVLN